MKKIICDIDNVIGNFSKAYSDQSYKLFKIKLDGRKAIYEIDIYFLGDKKAYKLWNHFVNNGGFGSEAIIPNSLESIKKLYENGYEIVFLTSRPPEVHEETVVWLKRKGFLKYGRLMRVWNRNHNKERAIKKLKPAFLMEDRLDTVLPYKNSKDVIPMLYAKNYNKTSEIPRFRNWRQITKYILNNKKEREKK